MSADSRHAKRLEMIPKVAHVFATMGYRRSTSAHLAKSCGVQENILYRLWSDKKAMFIAAIDYVYRQSEEAWLGILRSSKGNGAGTLRLLDHEAKHHGESGLHRIVLAGMSEIDDADIRKALQNMYKRFHRFIAAQIASHRKSKSGLDLQEQLPDVEISAWTICALGILSDIGRELNIFKTSDRKRLLADMGQYLLDGRPRRAFRDSSVRPRAARTAHGS